LQKASIFYKSRAFFTKVKKVTGKIAENSVKTQEND